MGNELSGIKRRAVAFAKINSQEITYQEFEKVVQQQIEQMRQQNQGKDVSEEQIKQVRDQVWNSLVSQTLTKQAIEKYGIKVSDQEILDWIYNRPETLPEPIKKNFMDSTGVFNIGFYQQALNMKTKEATQFWAQVENYIRETLLSEKLQAILTEGVVVSEADVLEKYKDDNIMANFNYVLLDLNTITDSSQFAVNESELKKYYDEHKIDFKQRESVKMKYLLFQNAATAEDSANMLKQMESYQKQLRALDVNDSAVGQLISDNSNVSWNSDYQKSNAFEIPVQNFLFNAKDGDVSDIILGKMDFRQLNCWEQRKVKIFMQTLHIYL